MAESPAKPRLATVWLGGCSGCHMSFLDIDERMLLLAEAVERRVRAGAAVVIWQGTQGSYAATSACGRRSMKPSGARASTRSGATPRATTCAASGAETASTASVPGSKAHAQSDRRRPRPTPRSSAEAPQESWEALIPPRRSTRGADR